MFHQPLMCYRQDVKLASTVTTMRPKSRYFPEENIC